MARSVLAIVVGFLIIGALSFGTDALLHQVAPGAFNANGGGDNLTVLIGSQLYVGVYAIFGCWLTARMAPSRPIWPRSLARRAAVRR